ncbi:DedA family protein [Streptomyces coelicoflavus]|uniref:DedA family protein n=1 Tax=Streptomyces coelicoflavus TaxID=285562 RepID=UPI0036AC7F28
MTAWLAEHAMVHGGCGILTAVPRTLMPTLCGATGMPLRRYLLWSVVSSAVWAPAFALIGYVMGPAGPG